MFEPPKAPPTAIFLCEWWNWPLKEKIKSILQLQKIIDYHCSSPISFSLKFYFCYSVWKLIRSVLESLCGKIVVSSLSFCSFYILNYMFVGLFRITHKNTTIFTNFFWFSLKLLNICVVFQNIVSFLFITSFFLFWK